MKCGYAYCKLGGQVEKEEAVKKGNRYWHKECAHEAEVKAEIKDAYYKKFESKEPARNVNTAIKKFVNDQGYDADYVLFCLKYKTQNLNSIYGLSYALSYKKNEKDFKKEVARNTKIVYNDISDEVIELQNKPKTNKTTRLWGDFF